MKRKRYGSRSDIYSRVTDEIVKAIEAGTEHFEMPWHRNEGGLPKNAATKKVYQGVNILVLWAGGERLGYASQYWATYRQWLLLGAQVRKGEKGLPVVFYKQEEKEAALEHHSNDTSLPRALLRFSTVFNSEQVEGWTAPQVRHSSKVEVLEDIEDFIQALGSDIRIGGDRACYIPSKDRILMPPRTSFKETKAGSAVEGYYSTLMHEHIHWTGHASRLDRELSVKFGAEGYAMEELVAELGAAFLCSSLGISTTPRPDHASYIQSWLKVLKEQKSAIFTAARAATAASQFLESLGKEVPSEELVL